MMPQPYAERRSPECCGDKMINGLKLFSSSLMLQMNKLECFFSVVKYFQMRQ